MSRRHLLPHREWKTARWPTLGSIVGKIQGQNEVQKTRHSGAGGGVVQMQKDEEDVEIKCSTTPSLVSAGQMQPRAGVRSHGAKAARLYPAAKK